MLSHGIDPAIFGGITYSETADDITVPSACNEESTHSEFAFKQMLSKFSMSMALSVCYLGNNPKPSFRI
ncbi:hypothetical protein ACR78H_16405 [Sphingobacterium siyangense]